MKRIFLPVCALMLFGGAVMADGNAFTPLNFNDTGYGSNVSTKNAVNTLIEEATGNGNIQNAITQLESAQVDIRNDLLNCKTKYNDVDAQYKLIKEERASLRKQVRNIEKRIKEIETAKERIRKNML